LETAKNLPGLVKDEGFPFPLAQIRPPQGLLVGSLSDGACPFPVGSPSRASNSGHVHRHGRAGYISPACHFQKGDRPKMRDLTVNSDPQKSDFCPLLVAAWIIRFGEYDKAGKIDDYTRCGVRCSWFSEDSFSCGILSETD
jgi:hypothetical protein